MTEDDRIFRIVLATLFAILYFTHLVPVALGVVLVISAIIFLATSLAGFCPIYWAMGLERKKEVVK